MGADTAIEWAHHSFNPWWGCAKVSEGCKNCYAETFAKRVGQQVWGEGGPRRTFGAKHWLEPIGWDRVAMRAGRRERVFCASMADVFEDHAVAEQERPRLWALIAETPCLDWLLLTKRPENVARFVPWGEAWPDNVWLGVTAENNDQARNRVPLLAEIPARVRFVSAEPLLEEPDWVPTDIDWVIWGGESGPRARPCATEWLEVGVQACRLAGASPFVKQLGAHVVSEDRVDLEGRWAWRARLRDAKGGDWSEWPEGLRVRELPEVRA